MGELEEVLARVRKRTGHPGSEPRDGLGTLLSRLGVKYGTAPESPPLVSVDSDPERQPDAEPADEEIAEAEIYWGEWVNRLPVLSHEEHVALASDIEAGVYAQAVLDGLFIYREDVSTDDLLRLVEIGRRAFDLMLTSNLKLVRYWTSIYARGDLNIVEDMFQDAFFGLHRAVEGWDARRGYRFSTYATWRIRQSLQRSHHGGSTQKSPVHIPAHVYEHLAHCEKSGEPPSALGEHALDWMRAISWEVLSEEIPDFYSEVEEDFDEPILTTVSTYHSARQCLNLLSDDYASVIEERFGFIGEPMTLDAIGESRGVTRERIRQIEKNALEQVVIHVATQVDELRPRLIELLRQREEVPAKLAVEAIRLRLGTRQEIKKTLHLQKKEASDVAKVIHDCLRALDLDISELPKIWIG